MRVKCRRDGELPDGRRGEALRCIFRIPLLHSVEIPLCTVERLFKGGIFILENKKRYLTAHKVKNELTCPIFSREYWREAYSELSSARAIAFAAMIIALRVAVKMFKIPIGAGLNVTFDCYVNALGSIVYGPVVGLLVGAISDTIGCIIHPTGPYFFPFIFVEMSSSFIFGLFLWRRKISVGRVLCTKFSINLFCNIFLTSVFMKWMYTFLGDARAITYNVFNLARIAKNLVMFPIESILIVLVLGMFSPLLKILKVVPLSQGELIIKKKHVILVLLTTALSIALILFYVFFLKGFIDANNIKFF